MINIDQLIIGFDKGLRTLFAPAQTLRAVPGDAVQDAPLDEKQRRVSAALTARAQSAKQALEQAAQEETEHLAWTERRIAELGGAKSVLNPLFYAGSFAIGALSGLLGDKWNLGFLVETERQVVRHLEGHLDRLPAQDQKSRAIVEQMRDDEARHATSALEHGATELPAPLKAAMKASSKVMTETAYWL